MKYTLPQLNYAYNALEPFIDERTMTIHHTKHHQAYVDNLNVALDKHPELYNQELTTLLQSLESLPTDIQTAVRNNGGGHFNHTLFWELLTPKQMEVNPTLLAAIEKEFKSFEDFKTQFAQAATTRFGSGWAWLVLTSENKLMITSTPNQDTPLNLGKPLLALDVWEHAYYLNYQNRRADYIKAFWNIVNWDKVNELYVKNLQK